MTNEKRILVCVCVCVCCVRSYVVCVYMLFGGYVVCVNVVCGDICCVWDMLSVCMLHVCMHSV